MLINEKKFRNAKKIMKNVHYIIISPVYQKIKAEKQLQWIFPVAKLHCLYPERKLRHLIYSLSRFRVPFNGSAPAIVPFSIMCRL